MTDLEHTLYFRLKIHTLLQIDSEHTLYFTQSWYAVGWFGVKLGNHFSKAEPLRPNLGGAAGT
jgi:hypothetical protein